MGRGLLDFHAFEESLMEIEKILKDLGCDWSVKGNAILHIYFKANEVILKLLLEEADSRINRAESSQTCIAALQIALVDTLRDLGLAPKAVVGHSSGEIIAA